MGAAVAAGWSIEEMIERFRRAFVDVNPIGDYALPGRTYSGRRSAAFCMQALGMWPSRIWRCPFFACLPI